MSKCIKCGRELTTSEPLEMYNGMCAKCYWNRHYSSIITNIDDETVICGSLGTFKMLSIEEYNKLQDQINQLKQQLEKEKAENKTLKEFADKLDEEFGKNVEPTLSERADNIIALHRSNKKYCEMADEKIKELKLQLAEKDKEINSLILDYEKRISQEQELMSNMEHRLTEKQNTIDEINKEFVQAVHDWKTLCAEKDKEIEKLKSEIVKECKEHRDFIKEAKQITNQLKSNYQTQLAIQKLEKVKENLKQLEINIDNQAGFSQGYKLELKQKSLYKNVYKTIDQQIKELKGEKDVKD